jgi:hypothetical protein
MKIINTIDKQVEFVSIKVGECFLYDNCLFVKMNPVKITDGSPNAFCFVDNAVACVPQACLVTPVDAEIVVRSKGAE